MHNITLQNWSNSSCLSKNNQLYIEEIYKIFLQNPNSVDPSWIKIFQYLSLDKKIDKKNAKHLNNTTYLSSKHDAITNTPNQTSITSDIFNNTTYIQLSQLINAFRTYGYQYAILDPLNLQNKTTHNPLLELENYNFSSKNFKNNIDMTPFGLNKKSMNIMEVYSLLKKIYCGSIGIEYMHIINPKIILWLQKKLESSTTDLNFNDEEKKQFLKEIAAAEGLERYLGTKFPGVKRFSLEGGDALIPMLKETIRHSVHHHGITEIFIGMAHRGRLNVLINILGKNPKNLFNEFSNANKISNKSGDVKYHQGFYSDVTLNGNTVHLSLLCNPSHLEIVNPVVMGTVRARIDQLSIQSKIYHCDITTNNTILPILIHGDAAISAQGIVQETFNLSKTRAYSVGGTVHIIINNQIGFTTSNIRDMRSTQHCTDIAKMIQAPIFHVNADDIESVIYITRIALNFRNEFKHDVVIDLICYRRHGHNEADEPSVTQPIMYKKIRNHPTLINIYSNALKKQKIINQDDNIKLIKSYREILEKKQCVLQKWQPIRTNTTLNTNNLINNEDIKPSKHITQQYLKNLAYHISNIPAEINMHSRVKKIFFDRTEMAKGKKLFDWGAAEILAYATLLDQGISIRLSGEDVARGTFFHRHAIIYDQNSGEKYIPLEHRGKPLAHNKQGHFFIWDSVLSEEAALAFEYGYANTAKNMLIIWEAQFGDFSNGAQVVIDQFISASEQKWGQLCGLVMLLPHGYEGQGPEHSSARIERYLQLCSENNMQICIPSTPGQIYHKLRYQGTCAIKKPLIIISPKSLLRHPMVNTSLENLSHGSFQTIFGEIDKNILINKTNRVIICSGKVFYDLLEQRRKNQQHDIAIIRIEQLYPFPQLHLETILNSYYAHTEDFVWCQEEPKNQGAWYYMQNHIQNIMPSNITLKYIGRPDAAAPATGYLSTHQTQQKKLINDALHTN
ncbi:2-oxoglutarate dehydrogenase E1 component [Candidatus Blochmannia ocreatus (nom. nud.)]|uniref:oxoglutarate dehydrogenase (succinyl-transferring) n=1 Tax=Candidatus Blochmannia ocreatus (nom. nud.) TaxID=251538 RepID=A0ABY4SU32_9ENTR|nr:2-oxoglutarate dehydrogenase E1 component [Candidatus Blochmannia ocreatus]URJ25391.1 2-oxoglutarate dehydrogenase E1 component [Candidatus Blochmannia ocreatus]